MKARCSRRWRPGASAYYVCDFPGAALNRHEHVIALPHLGASTREAEENCAVMVVDQLRDFLEHGQVANAVNFPQVSMARESAYRVAIANANVPNMLGQISTTMAAVGLNIHNMVNKSRGEMAYTLVDVDSAVGDDGARQPPGHRRRAVGALPATRRLRRNAEWLRSVVLRQPQQLALVGEHAGQAAGVHEEHPLAVRGTVPRAPGRSGPP